MKQTTLKILNSTHDVSPLLYGLFLEDINFACDGGLNVNIIANHSFDGVYMELSYNQMDALTTKKPPKFINEHLRYWEIEGGVLSSETQQPASKKNPLYARIQTDSHCIIKNKGYNGGQINKNSCGISVKKGHKYEISCYLRNVNFEGNIYAIVTDEQGIPMTEKVELHLNKTWNVSKEVLPAISSGHGLFQFEVIGVGSFDIDCISLSDTDVWGKDQGKWSGGHFRRDLIEALKDLKPTFLRFPGGCIVEGLCPGNEYRWKDTVGPIIDRVPAVNLWAAAFEEKGYSQSNQIGFYEYFLLCEDLQVEPLPIVWAGINCQFRSEETLATDSEEFYERVLKNALDLIEYANGDPAVNEWARLRSESGHPEPFKMKMIGIGNENHGDDYLTKFEKVKAAIKMKYPEITCIMSSGAFPEGDDFEETWKIAKKKFPDVRIDEHFYKANEWLYQQVNRYDNYDRNTAKVFLGEYAANEVMKPHTPNTFGSALAEAAFLTGVERNSDVVVMSSYAPLFSMAGGMQWNHNMIWFNPENVMKTPNYFVQQLYGAHLGEHVVAYEGKLPEGVFISVTKTETKYYIKIVNANQEAIEIELILPQTVETSALHLGLQNDDLEAVNELNFVGEPVYNVSPFKDMLKVEKQTMLCKLQRYSVNVYEVYLIDLKHKY